MYYMYPILPLQSLIFKCKAVLIRNLVIYIYTCVYLHTYVTITSFYMMTSCEVTVSTRYADCATGTEPW